MQFAFVGFPMGDDDEAGSDDTSPEIVEPDFKITVDDTEWRG